MAVAALETREDKLKWLMRPVNWASSLSFISAFFGGVHWYYGFFDANEIVVALCVALGVNSALLFWAIARMTTAARN